MKAYCLMLVLILICEAAAEEKVKPVSPSEIQPQPFTYSLEQFGSIDTAAHAREALVKGMEYIKKKGGGILVIPPQAPADLAVINNSQDGPNVPFVNIVDLRGGGQVDYLAPYGAVYTPSGISAPHSFRRLMMKPMPWQGVYSSLSGLGHYVHGPSSFNRKLAKPVQKGLNRKWYVESIVGVYVGQNLKVTTGFGFDPPFSDIVVKEIGWDAEIKEHYFVADAPNNHPTESLVYNKNVINAMTLEDISPSDNQSMAFMVMKKQYGQGDSFGVSASLFYQGNIMSAYGDEGAVVGNFEIIHDIVPFRGIVEKRPDAQSVVYKQEGAKWTEKLATSRPLINLNEKKWMRKGKVRVYITHSQDYPDNKDACVIGVGTKWKKDMVGRYFAVDDPTERIEPKDPSGGGYSPNPDHVVYRWWLIREVKDNKDGTQSLLVERTRWGVWKTSPWLMVRANHWEYSKKEFNYIIAPGANVWDVSRANPLGQMVDRTIRVVPNSDFKTTFDFEPGDPIEQAVGPDPFNPIGVRIRHFSRFPSTIEDASFQALNYSTVPVRSGLHLGGPPTGEELRKIFKGDYYAYQYGIDITTPTRVGIRFNSDVEDAALFFDQPKGKTQPIWWRVEKGLSTLSIDPKEGTFQFAGGDVHLAQKSLRAASGISGSDMPAHNLRGINVKVSVGATSHEVKFSQPEEDDNYLITVEPGWLTLHAVTLKAREGFTVRFAEAAPASAKFDWVLIR